MSNSKYKVGVEVWIKEDMIPGKTYPKTGTHYQINDGESDIRGKKVTIISKYDRTGYNCKEYHNFHWKMIDEEKTNNNTPNYEIY